MKIWRSDFKPTPGSEIKFPTLALRQTAAWSLRLAAVASLILSWASPVLAAEESEAGWGLWETVGRFFNLFLLVGILVYFVRRPLVGFFENRRAEIKQRMTEADARHREADGKIREIEERMARLEQDLGEIRRRAEAEMQEEARRLEDSSRRESEKILVVAGREIDGMVRVAQKELRQYAGSLSVGLAEEMIRRELGPADQERILDGFVSQMENRK